MLVKNELHNFRSIHPECSEKGVLKNFEKFSLEFLVTLEALAGWSMELSPKIYLL